MKPQTGSIPPTPKLYGVVATQAPIAVIFLVLGQWFHVMRWRFNDGILEPGAWARKRLYPEACDLSSDGELISFFLSGSSGGYVILHAVSRCPWMRPLFSEFLDDTYGGGLTFVIGKEADAMKHHSARTIPVVFGSQTRTVITQRPRHLKQCDSIPHLDSGWRDIPRDIYSKDAEGRTKADARSGSTLHETSMPWSQWCRPNPGPRNTFEITLPSGNRVPLPDVLWADFDHSGGLLLGTKPATLHRARINHDGITITQTFDLSGLTPNPTPAPDWTISDGPRPEPITCPHIRSDQHAGLQP